jgi:hypothetical protein
MSAAATIQGTAFWRVAGMNFLQYQHVAGACVRSSLKKEFKDVAAKRETVHFRVRNWANGERTGEALTVDSALQRVGGA